MNRQKQTSVSVKGVLINVCWSDQTARRNGRRTGTWAAEWWERIPEEQQRDDRLKLSKNNRNKMMLEQDLCQSTDWDEGQPGMRSREGDQTGFSMLSPDLIRVSAEIKQNVEVWWVNVKVSWFLYSFSLFRRTLSYWVITSWLGFMLNLDMKEGFHQVISVWKSKKTFLNSFWL